MARTLVGQRIRDFRKAQGLTQAALAQRVGISPSYLNLIESDRRNIAGALLHRIADTLARPLEDFDGAAERRLAQDLAEAAAGPALAPLQLAPASAAELVASHPRWAHALITLHRSGLDQQQAVAALADRLSHDPFLGDALHNLLTNLTAIRSASEILESVEDLAPPQRQRFVAMIAEDSRRLSGVAQALATFLGRGSLPSRGVTPTEEVDDFVFARGNHFPALEAAAEALAGGWHGEAGRLEDQLTAYLKEQHRVDIREADARQSGLSSASRFDAAGRVLELPALASPAGRRFALARTAAELACGPVVAAELGAAQRFEGTSARGRAERVLLSYVAGAIVLPYERFHAAARDARFDADVLARRFDASFEQVAHRLATLRRPGAEGVPFGFMRADPAGFVSKRLGLAGLALPRYGGACPLWAVYAAFHHRGSTVRQLVEFPGGERYLMVARTVEKHASTFGVPPRLLSVMLFCDALHADRTVYGDGLDRSPAAAAIPVGHSCRICVRRECAWRQEDPIIDAGMY